MTRNRRRVNVSTGSPWGWQGEERSSDPRSKSARFNGATNRAGRTNGTWSPLRALRHLHVIARSGVFAQTTPRPKLRLSPYSCFALVLYQPKFPERILGLSAVV